MAEKEYIEREAVLDYIDKRKWKMIADPDGKHRLSIEVVEDVIKDFPAANVVEADVVPVRHGRWIAEYDCGYITPHCSKCGETALTKEETSYDYVYSSYCHNCGAKMDGDPDADKT